MRKFRVEKSSRQDYREGLQPNDVPLRCHHTASGSCSMTDKKMVIKLIGFWKDYFRTMNYKVLTLKAGKTLKKKILPFLKFRKEMMG